MEDAESFCTELHKKTKVIHDKSDKLVNLKLAIVVTDTKLYGKVLVDFYHVYLTMENALEQNRDHPLISPLVLRSLFRAESFEKDLEFYLGTNWRKDVQLSKQAQDYCDRLASIAITDPVLLIAYAHSMYMAILAGGQIISRILRRALGLSGSEGLALFEFQDGSKSELKATFKQNIDGLELDRETKDRIIQEKCRVFQMNNAIVGNVKPTISSFKRILFFFLVFVTILVTFLTVIILYFN